MATARISADDGASILVGVVGDSISAGTPNWDPDPAVRARIESPDDRSAWPYWAAHRDPRLAFVVSAVDGEKTDEIAERMDLVLGGGVSALVIQGGINDLVNKRTPAEAAAGIESMVVRAVGLRIPVAVPDILPWNRGYPDGEGPIRELNRLLEVIADRHGITILPFHATLEDPERPGRMLEKWTADGSHPSVAGHKRLGELAFRVPEAVPA